MTIVAVVPEKHAGLGSDREALFRVILAVLVRVGAIDEVKRGLSGFFEVPSCSIRKMLPDASRAGTTPEFSAHDAATNKVKIILGKHLLCILFGREAFGQVQGVDDGAL
jgi:hypothetical protein